MLRKLRTFLLAGERIRPRTKNVSYHVLQSEKLPLATFPEPDKDTQQAVENLLKMEHHSDEANQPEHSNGIIYMDQVEQPPDVAAEQTVESEEPVPVTMVEIKKRTRSSSNSLKPGRHIIGPGSKVRLVKEGMIVSKVKSKKSDENEVESILPDVSPTPIAIKEEVVQHCIKQEIMDPSPLHELAEISMQHANATAKSLFKCEMCSEVFSDRAQLLVHVPIHI